MSGEERPHETTRVWVQIYDDPEGGILAYADTIPCMSDFDLARIVLDIPPGVGLGPDGPMHVKVGGERE